MPAIMALFCTCMIITLPCAAMADPLADDQPSARSVVVVTSSDRWADHIAEAAEYFAIPERWIRAVMTVESAGDVRALSSAGAMGLMQIMPATWEELRMRHRLGNDPYGVRDNILAGAAYLREMHDRYGNVPAMLAAYNAGPGKYEKHLDTGDPLPAETVAYIARIMPMIASDEAFPLPNERQSAGSKTANSPLFAVTTNRASASHSSLFATPSVIESGDGKTADSHPSGRPSNTGTITALSALAPPSDGLFIPRSHHGVTE